ncbi:hypothetical protein C8R44DRAFT_982031 [Mycena epipterygia]|nr:hypothetical protein C8R44DRAFT_982031 [Mycena epipterygia]
MSSSDLSHCVLLYSSEYRRRRHYYDQGSVDHDRKGRNATPATSVAAASGNSEAEAEAEAQANMVLSGAMSLRVDLLCPYPRDALSLVLCASLSCPAPLTTVDATPYANLGTMHCCCKRGLLLSIRLLQLRYLLHVGVPSPLCSTSDLSSDPDQTHLLRPASCSMSDRVVCLSNVSTLLLLPTRPSLTLLAPSFPLLPPPSPLALPPPFSRRTSQRCVASRRPSPFLLHAAASHPLLPLAYPSSNPPRRVAPLLQVLFSSSPSDRVPPLHGVSHSYSTSRIPSHNYCPRLRVPRRCLISSSCTPLPPIILHTAASSPSPPAALQLNKIKNRVLKLTGAVRRNKIRIAQPAAAAAGTDTSSLGDRATPDSRCLHACTAFTAIPFPFATLIPYLRSSSTHPRHERLLPSLF